MNWEYCECGCHCHVAEAGNVAFHLFNDLSGGYWLRRTLFEDGVRYTSFEDADKAANQIVKNAMKEMRKALKPKK
jgi:hypothetical protein